MRGVILAGGTGSRLDPLTRATNKHLLPLGRRPMVCGAVETLAQAGLRDVLVITTPRDMVPFMGLLADRHEYGLERLALGCQERPGGIPDAIGMAERFADGSDIAVLLADNVFGAPLGAWVKGYSRGASVLLHETDDLAARQESGVADFADGRLRRVAEKPAQPPSRYVVTGAYLFDAHVFEAISTLTPSARGELEIADLLNHYADHGALEHDIIGGYWSDAGRSIDAYYVACDFVRRQEAACATAS